MNIEPINNIATKLIEVGKIKFDARSRGLLIVGKVKKIPIKATIKAIPIDTTNILMGIVAAYARIESESDGGTKATDKNIPEIAVNINRLFGDFKLMRAEINPSRKNTQSIRSAIFLRSYTSLIKLNAPFTGVK